jgi:hypothetical protein
LLRLFALVAITIPPRPKQFSFRANSGQVESSFVLRGLDPRIHADWPQIDSTAWIAGSSPAKTREVRFNSIEHAPAAAPERLADRAMLRVSCLAAPPPASATSHSANSRTCGFPTESVDLMMKYARDPTSVCLNGATSAPHRMRSSTKR